MLSQDRIGADRLLGPDDLPAHENIDSSTVEAVLQCLLDAWLNHAVDPRETNLHIAIAIVHALHLDDDGDASIGGLTAAKSGH